MTITITKSSLSKVINYKLYGDAKGPLVLVSSTRKLRIDSSESEKAESVEELDEEWPEEYKKIFRTDNHKLNNYQQPIGDVFEFLGSDFYLKQFQRTFFTEQVLYIHLCMWRKVTSDR